MRQKIKVTIYCDLYLINNDSTEVPIFAEGHDNGHLNLETKSEEDNNAATEEPMFTRGQDVEQIESGNEENNDHSTLNSKSNLCFV